jgi:ribosomal protein L10
VANPVKVEAVKELHDIFSRAKSAVVANYQGMDAQGITALRVHMKGRSVDFRVVKNTLARRAVKDTVLEVLSEDFRGPVSIVVGFDDAVAPAKALADFALEKISCNSFTASTFTGFATSQPLYEPDDIISNLRKKQPTQTN